MKQTKFNEIMKAYNELTKAWDDGRSTRNSRNIKANQLIAKFTKVEMFQEFFKLLLTQDKIVERDCIEYVVLKFNVLRDTHFRTDDIIYSK